MLSFIIRAIVVSGMLLGVVLLVDLIPVEQIALLIEFIGGVFPDYSNFFAIAIVGISGVLVIVGLMQIRYRSRYKLDAFDEEILSNIHLKEKEFRLQVEKKQLDDIEKTRLRQEILALRQEYQLLSGKILQNQDGGYVEDWRSVLLSARKRLLDEEDRMLTRNSTNLGIAILMIAVGIVFLMYATSFIARPPSNANIWVFLATYGPTLSIVVLIEIPTFFFLRLYSSNERKIERNKSDLTNIELRLTAGLMLYEKINKDNFAILADNISKEDSNFILGKNESSGGIDPNKLLEIIKATK